MITLTKYQLDKIVDYLISIQKLSSSKSHKVHVNGKDLMLLTYIPAMNTCHILFYDNSETLMINFKSKHLDSDVKMLVIRLLNRTTYNDVKTYCDSLDNLTKLLESDSLTITQKQHLKTNVETMKSSHKLISEQYVMVVETLDVGHHTDRIYTT